MRLLEVLIVGGVELPVVKRDIRLELSTSGRATFRVRSAERPRGLVVYRCGYSGHQLHDFFAGYIEQAQQDGAVWVLICRELVHALSLPSPVSLRQCEAADVLRDVARATEVQFVGMSSGQAPRFASHADGFAALRHLPVVFSIDDFVFFQQTDGRVWCGAWSDSEYVNNRLIHSSYFSRHTPNAAVLPAMPVLRPGMPVNDRRVAGVRLTHDHETHITWSR